MLFLSKKLEIQIIRILYLPICYIQYQILITNKRGDSLWRRLGTRNIKQNQPIKKKGVFARIVGPSWTRGHAFVRIVVKLLSAMPKDLGKQDERNRLPETRQNARPSMRDIYISVRVAARHALPQVSHLIDCLYDADIVIRKDTADSLLGDGTLRSIERWNTAHREEMDAHDEALAA